MTGMDVVVFGAGGHAKVVISTLRAAGHRIVGLYDDDPAKWGSVVLGVKVSAVTEGASGIGVIAIGDNRTRQQIAARTRNMEWCTVIHPDAYVDPTVRMGVGTVVFAGAVIQPDTVIGNHVIVNTGATVDHDCRLGDFVHVAPGCHLAGQVVLDTGVLMGIGSVAIPGVHVNAWATVGAGGVATRDIPAHVVAVGVPARVIVWKEGSRAR